MMIILHQGDLELEHGNKVSGTFYSLLIVIETAWC
jgi:hypothetical protein